MSVTNTPRKAGPYTGNNTDVQYTFGFKVFADSDLVVTRAVIATGAESTLVLTTDYSVTRNADQDVSPGGHITLAAALADTYTLTLTSEVAYTQPAVFTNLGGFFPAVLNNALDRLTILVQQLKETVSRSLKLAVSTPTGFDATLPAPVAYGVLGFNGTADGFAVTDPSGSSALAGDLANRTDATKNAGMMGLDQSLNYAVGTIGWFCRESAILATAPLIGVSDGAVGDYNGTSGTDDTTALNAAITYAASVGKVCYIPGRAYGTGYLTTSTLLAPVRSQICGDHRHMGYTGGTTIWFKPTVQDNFLEPTGLPATLKDGYHIRGLMIIGNSTSATGNSDIGLNIDNIIKSVFAEIRVQGFRTGIRCYATNSNQFHAMHPTDNYVQSVLYAGGIATTDNWWGGYISNAPILVNTSGSNISIKFIGTAFEGAGTHSVNPTDQAIGINLVKETENFEFAFCYGEDSPNTDNVNNAMFMIGRDGSATTGVFQARIIGGSWKGRAAGNRGAYIKTHTIDGVYLGGGANIAQYTTVVDNSDAATLTNQIVLGDFGCTSVSTIVADDTKVTGTFPIGTMGSGTRNQQTYRLAGDQLPGSSTACTGAITTSAAWKLTKDGIVVTLTLPSVTGTATALPSFTFGQALPAKYRPSATVSQTVPIKDNGADQATQGLVSIDYLTGNITVYKDGSRTANFTNAATAGLTDAAVISWTV